MSSACLHVPPWQREVDKGWEGQPRCLAGMWCKELPLPLRLGCGDSAD